MTTPVVDTGGPLGAVTSIKVKLGLLVAASVLVASVLSTLGAGAVPALLGIPVTVLLALGVTQLLAVGMTSPLRQMTVAARRMAAGDYDVRVAAGSNDEVGELARAFNRMAADLATVDRQRRDLVATVSHELRTPLAALVAVLENLDDRVTEPDPHTIHVALGQAQRLSELVADLLDLSRVEAGVVPLDRGPVAMAPLVGEVAGEVGDGGRGVRVDVLVEPPALEIVADRSRLHQLMVNLLDNAVRHSPDGGVVRILVAAPYGVPRIEVIDEGPGIAPDDRERVFERYGTLRDDGGGGTGLGLAIARWVAELHGGRIALLDPRPGEHGAHFRVELPAQGRALPPPPAPEGRPVVTTSVPLPPPTQVVVPTSLVDATFGQTWREDDLPARRGVLLACLAIGVFAGLTLPFNAPGLAASLVLIASGGLVLALSRTRDWFSWTSTVLCLGFAMMVAVRDAAWIVTLGLLASALLVAAALTRATTLPGMVIGALAWPLSGLRGLPWLGRTLRAFGGSAGSLAAVRTVVVSLVAVLVFGALFASGDAIVGSWVGAALPDVRGSVLLRLFVVLAVGGIVLAASYLALNPPDTDPTSQRRPTQHRFEWLAPVLLVDAVFVVFLAAQAAAVFGGHDYVRQATGLTYAEYVHQGFAQLTVATVLTLLVVWAAARKVAKTAADQWWLRASLGALCLMTLVVVGSALHRMDLYQQAYGFTRLRLLVDAFEGWLGLVVLAVLVAGVGLRGGWLPRMALLSGATVLLALAVANPDAWIARHNIERYHATGKVDWDYLKGLSADATPTFAKLTSNEATCVLDPVLPDADPWTAWNLARARARHALIASHLELGMRSETCP
jgi:two-component system sensor histidine kinase BaeS